ncbi:uncharacterized protein BX663DRAFT_198676 [Cokeromyces recurvatus]|uniref:uncharacterized protein n=1 Tax=Cokeromyces recurvatus TaxID=90255 RepID=UPI00221F4163|nr:uncharacterized protein BX663DRAFT_198676 [Cokeromyces recurvatus]KAI7906601.1 hypothetical protein BX663DRAFT_198676 [Cokeromyces recurvatus]
MRDIPFTKIRNFGGKLGNEVGSEFEILKSSELWQFSIEDFQKKFGESTGIYLYNICRGIDNEEVSPTKAPKSMMAAKSFNPSIKTPQEMEKWFSILAAELRNRIMRHFEEYGTWPKTITIRYASIHHRSYRSKSLRSFSQSELKTPEIIAKRCGQLFNSLGDGYPCIGLDFCASNFSSSTSSYRINQFFTKTNKPIHDSSSPSVMNTIDTKKKGGLFSYLANTGHKTNEDNDSFLCEKCNKRIHITAIEEHSDYHFALTLMDEEKNESSKRRENRDEEEKSIKKKQKKTLFFQSKNTTSS